MSEPKILICPYCGETQATGEVCRACSGRFDPLSRQATHNAMGPWFVRDARRPFQPGCSYHTLVQLIDRGRITRYTIVRGPTTRQYWTVAKRVPGVAHLLGYCHECGAAADSHDHGCRHCGAPFSLHLDRDLLGLPEIRPLPWEGDMDDGDGAGGPRTLASEAMSRGISSFATDEELLAHAPPRGAVVLPFGAGSAASAVAPAETDLLGSSMRALQRSLEQARRQKRTLAMLLGLAVVALIVGTVPRLVALATRNSPGAGDESAEAHPSEPAAARKGAATRAHAADPSGQEDAAARQTLPPDDEPERDEAPAANSAPPPAPDPAPPPAPPFGLQGADGAKVAEALRLEATGADASVAPDVRIQAYERAAALLREVAPSAAPQQLPKIEERIRKIEEDAERLRLVSEFFDDGA